MTENNMHVHIYINDVEYTEYTIAYTREAKICTGIGTLTATFAPTLPHEIITWDNIVIEENGNTAVGSYYVTSISKSQPSSEWSIVAQDASKRLTDHFIDQTFYIDYPSSSIPWLEYFLRDAGVTYSIDTPGPGSYLSNNTQLGMVSNYDQIITLLQMNGWYMYFDADDTCHIGNLSKGGLSDTFNTDDILSIDIIEHDKMLRNRVLVLGAASPFGGGYVHAEIQQKTKWNYDAKDIRTAVIANSNIPTSADAMNLATTAFKEFAKITVEKHITVKEARGLYIGDTVRVHHNLFEGTGLVTTYGTSMSKEGLVSNVILDERCPRLFGFFKPPEYVYVATYGDGVYTKALETDPNWYDVSYGLTDTRVTDLHINKGIFVCATASGGAFYANNTPVITPGSLGASGTVLESLLWKPLSLEGLHPISGGYTDLSYTYSGLKARAVILDRNYSHMHIAADERMVENFGDYIYSTNYANLPTILSGVVMGSQPTASGQSMDFQSCIIEASPDYGTTKVYPIRLSVEQAEALPGIVIDDYIEASGLRKGIGIYDIENDTLTDYVSVGINVSGAMSIGDGKQENQFSNGFNYWNPALAAEIEGRNATYDSRNTTSYSRTKTTYYEEGEQDVSISVLYGNPRTIGMWGSMESSNVVYIAGLHTRVFPRYIITSTSYDFGEDPINPPLVTTTYEHQVENPTDNTSFNDPVQIRMDAWGVFSYVGGKRNASTGVHELKIVDYNPVADTVSARYVTCTPDISTVSNPHPADDWTWGIDPEGSGNPAFGPIIIGDWIYCGFVVTDLLDSTIHNVYLMKTNLEDGRNVFNKVYSYVGQIEVTTEFYLLPQIAFGQYGDDVQLVFHILHLDNVSVNNPRLYDFWDYDGELIRVTVKGFNGSAEVEQLADLGRHNWYYFVIGAGDLGGWYSGGTNDFSNKAGTNQNRILLETVFATSRDSEGLITSGRYFVDTIDTVTEFSEPQTISYSLIYKMGGVKENEPYGVAKQFTGLDVYSRPVYKLVYFNLETGTYIKDVTADGFDSVDDCYQEADALDGTFYFIGNKPIYYPEWDYWEDNYYTISVDHNGNVGREIVIIDGNPSAYYTTRQMSGNFIIDNYESTGTRFTYVYWVRNSVPTNGTIYLLLQRDGEDYNILKSGIFPERLDISKYSPLVTFQRTIETVNVWDITASGITVIGDLGMSGTDLASVSGVLFGSGILVQDFRYADLIFGANGLMPVPEGFDPGVMLQEIIVAYSGGLGIISTSDVSNISGIAAADVGSIARVEATNSYIPDQYIFVAKSGFSNEQAQSNGTTVSGDWGFSQRSPTFPFVDYSAGYPSARTTTIRIDDAL